MRVKAAPENNAFTLVEVLVVIAIVGVLAALALSGIGHLTRKARESQSFSNLRQIYVAFESYRTENSGFWPVPSDGDAGTTWSMSVLYPLVYGEKAASRQDLKDTIFHSPGSTDQLVMEHNPGNSNALKNYVARGYGMNRLLPPSDRNGGIASDVNFRFLPKRPTLVQSPSETALLMDITQAVSSYVKDKLRKGSERYGGYNHVLFCDGHVERIKFEDIPTDNESDFAGQTFWWGL